MKDYFLRLFHFDRYANQLIAGAIIKAGNPAKSVRLVAHLLGAQQVWLARCKGEPAISGAIWPDWHANAFDTIINENYRQWTDFLNGLTDDDFERIIQYSNSKGDQYQNKLTDVLGHLVNHGTHHRAQAGQYIKFTGADSLPNTDYIFYLRKQTPFL